MAGLPSSFNLRAAPFEVGSSSSSSGNNDRRMQSVERLVLDLGNSDLRENALLELSKKRELFQHMAPLLWNSVGIIAALLLEILSIYPYLSPPTLTQAQSNRTCNALTLLQCVASHQETWRPFLNVLQYQYPFYLLRLHVPVVFVEWFCFCLVYNRVKIQTRPFEHLRLASLGVIGALAKVDNTEIITSLLSTEIVTLCLRAMEMGSELSQTVATFIVQRILRDEAGLEYICTTAERFFAVSRALSTMVGALAQQHSSSRLLNQIIGCYLRLSDNARACGALRSCLPQALRDATFHAHLRDDTNTRSCLQRLLHNVYRPPVPMQTVVALDHFMINRLN